MATTTLAPSGGMRGWRSFQDWITSTDKRRYIGWFGVLMIPNLLAADLSFIVAFLAAPPVHIDGIREPGSGGLLYGNNIITAPGAAGTAVLVVYAIGQGCFPDAMPLGFSGTFNFMLALQTEHNVLMQPFQILG
jgi:hypothetical protein